MTEHIDRDALRQAVLESQYNSHHPLVSEARAAHVREREHFVAMIDRFPAADVAPVVRCGKCEYLRPTVNVHTGEQVGCWCSLWDLLEIGPDDFCSRGKYQTDGGAENAETE